MKNYFKNTRVKKTGWAILASLVIVVVPILASADEISFDMFVRMGTGYQTSDIEGDWWLHALDTPRNDEPDAFNWTFCDLAATSSGITNGTCYSSEGYSVPTGDFQTTVDTNGNVTLPVMPHEQDFTVMSASRDVMVGINNAPSGADQYMTIWIRKCTDCETRDLEGTWRSRSLSTKKNGEPDAFGYNLCDITLDRWGTIESGTCTDQDGVVDDISGQTVSVAPDGEVTHPTAPDETYMAYMGVNKDIIVEIINGPSYHNLNVLAKMDSPGNYATSNLAGDWQMRSMGTQLNGFPDAYKAEKCTMTVQADGAFESSCEDFEGTVEAKSGTLTVDSAGTVTLPSALDEQNNAVLSFGKDIIISDYKYRASADNIGVFRNGWWYLDSNGIQNWNAGDTSLKFGLSTDIPVAGDWNGDGTDDIGVYRKGWWYLDSNGTPGWNAGDTSLKFGLSTDIPVTGDWNGDGTADIGVYRKGWWYLDSNGTPGWNAGDTSLKFGLSTDIPVTGDWNGDGTTDIGVFRDGWWYLDSNGTPGWNAGDTSVKFGLTTDIIVTGDWNGDGATDIGVFRDRWWYLDSNGTPGWNAGDTSIKFGKAEDIPIAGNW